MERPPLVHFIHTAAFEKAAQAAAFADVSEEGKRLFKALTARLDRDPGPSR